MIRQAQRSLQQQLISYTEGSVNGDPGISSLETLLFWELEQKVEYERFGLADEAGVMRF
uniref:Uncharacterized protein n=1 Tax=Moniliophthora roreri TaxID=221103 RepID=A0A0W0FBY7_MONRR